ncbi:hypothetical protein DWB61_14235 [Ancylomarina euxinus]|uniref:Uncharacterized protein n=1 Tax=Ancylomarina euxinus TaxID=2283627 RepID=A0A425XY49_9BACT|nr:hypothetical protein [Ancylomarina euxinus]MCZ4695938.1 hypothetical protein [Ancylomarina euxinus]MUP16310.1 hypothetical protein [Ancylomarina euxinus]RRG19706.1 hypothetical protein DWB61_14235 [Ancylomarina euxinus]
MKKLFRNTISILLLVFYLTGFCGLNLLKHSCFACHQDDFHLIYDLDNCGDEMHVCKSDPHPHVIHFHGNSSHAHFNSEPCCALELIYLKNYPKTLVKQVVKSPLVSSLDLFLCVDLHFHNFIDTGNEVNNDDLQKIIDPPEITQELLCCYRC